MQVEDIPQVNEIDRECFPTQWPPAYRRDLLSNNSSYYLVYEEEVEPVEPMVATGRATEVGTASRLRQLLERMRGFIFDDGASLSATGQQIVGIVGLWIIADEAHITTIAVREAYQRQGIGELLLIAAMELAAMKDSRVVTLEVRTSNSAAQALYKKYGFTEVGMRRGYYTDNREDAVLMTTEAITSASFQSRFQRLKQAHARRWEPIYR